MSQPTHLHGHILDLILSPCDQNTIGDAKICDFISDHTLCTSAIAFPRQPIHTPNKVQYRRYRHISMSDLCSDLKNITLVKSTANSADDLYKQYAHDLCDVLERHAPLASRLTRKNTTGWMSDS